MGNRCMERKTPKSPKSPKKTSSVSMFPTVPKLEDMLIVSDLGMKGLNNLVRRYLDEGDDRLWAIYHTKLADHLCQLVLFPTPENINEAKEILEINPELLFIKGTAIDPSGRTIEGSPYQCVLGSEDYYDDMLGMMKSIIDKIDPERKNAIEQLCEQFPEYLRDFFPDRPEIKQESKEVKYQFQELADAISKEEFKDEKLSSQMEEVLRKFKESLKPKGPITKGKHFDVQILIDAVKVFENNLDSWEEKEQDKQKAFFWCQVIGYLERFLPTNYAQAFCQGLVDVFSQIDRNLKIIGKEDVEFFPLDSDPQSRLGFDFGIATTTILSHGGPVYKRHAASQDDGTVNTQIPLNNLIKLCQSKKNKLNKFTNWLHQGPVSEPETGISRIFSS